MLVFWRCHKLLIVYLLVLMSVDKLIVYGALLLVVAIVITFAYFIYCRRHFKECKCFCRIDRFLLKRMLSFSGWNFIGASSAILRDQGVNIAINLFVVQLSMLQEGWLYRLIMQLIVSLKTL